MLQLTLRPDDLPAFRRMLREQIAGAADHVQITHGADLHADEARAQLEAAQADLDMAWSLADQLPGGLGAGAADLLPT